MNRSSISNPPTSFPTDLERFIAKAISLYHTTRLAGVPAEQHITRLIRPWMDRERLSVTAASPQLQSTEAVERVALAMLNKHHEQNGMPPVKELGAFDNQYRIDARAAITALTSPKIVEVERRPFQFDDCEDDATSPTVDHCGIVEVNPEDFDLSKQDKDENSG